MGRMTSDPSTFEQLIEQYGDPADHLALSYFEALALAREIAGDQPREAADLMKLAERTHVLLERYGRRPEMVDGTARAVALRR